MFARLPAPLRSSLTTTLLVVLVTGLTTAGCGGDSGGDGHEEESSATPSTSLPESPPEGPAVRFDPSSEDFFDLPLPSDLRVHADGRIRFSEWEDLMGIGLTRLWLEAADELVEGWGVTSGLTIWFEAPIDPTTLPEPLEGSLWEPGTPAPSVFLIDVDPDSPELGRTFPLEFDVRNAPSARTPGNRLVAAAPIGLTRRPLTRYAFVVTRDLKAESGEPFAPSPALWSLLRGESVASARAGTADPAHHVEASRWLAERGLPTSEIAALVLFTTADPSARLRRVGDWVRTQPTPALGADGLEVLERLDTFTVLHGRHTAPVYQTGTRPYSSPPAGQIVFGDDGLPVISEQQLARFNVSIPPGPMPADGWPLLIYMHGSGGNWSEPIVRGNPFTEPEIGFGTARFAAEAGWATVGFDFPLHGDRSDPPDTTGLRLYNLTDNPRATIDNFIVSAAEMVLRTRFLIDLAIDPEIAPDVLDPGASPDGLIRFNPNRIAAFGQSMGSTLAVPWATIDDNVGTLFLHGSGGVLIEIAATAVQPFNLRPILELVLGYNRRSASESLTRMDPVLHYLQHYWDLVDPIAHSRHVALEPHPGIPPKHVYQHSGIDDGYFSVRARTAMAAALGLDALGPTIEPWLPRILEHAGRGVVTGPVTGNVADGAATGVAVEWCPYGDVRGHYVAFDLDSAREHLMDALRSIVPDGVLTVSPRAGFSTECPQANLDAAGP